MSNPAYEKYIESLETTYKTLKKMSTSLPTDNTYDGGRNAKGEPHGYGKMIYLGEGRKNGFGKMVYANGNIYEGNWINGIKNGFGKQTLDSGTVYEGEWSNDKKSGFGKLTLDSGTVYEGEWTNDKKNGQGKITYKNSSGFNNGDQYNGSWRDDVKHGDGVLTNLKGSILNEKWENGVLKSSGGKNVTISYFEHHDFLNEDDIKISGVYVGEIKDGKPHGEGTLTLPNGYKYSGSWSEGKKHGNGSSEQEISGVIESFFNGEFKYGRTWNGNGKGHNREGTWKNGIFTNGKVYGYNGVVSYEGEFNGVYGDFDDLYNGYANCENYFIGSVRNGKREHGRVYYYEGFEWVEGDFTSDEYLIGTCKGKLKNGGIVEVQANGSGNITW